MSCAATTSSSCRLRASRRREKSDTLVPAGAMARRVDVRQREGGQAMTPTDACHPLIRQESGRAGEQPQAVQSKRCRCEGVRHQRLRCSELALTLRSVLV